MFFIIDKTFISKICFYPATYLPVMLAFTTSLPAQSQIIEAPQKQEVTIAGDLVIEGNGDTTTASLEILGDLVVKGDQYLDGSLILEALDEDLSSPPSPGSIRYNSETADFEGYKDSAWHSLTFALPSDALFSGATLQGSGNTAGGVNSNVWGHENQSDGAYSTVWGSHNSTTGSHSTLWGSANTASAYNSTLWGYGNQADGIESTAWGYNNRVRDAYTTAWGSSNSAESAYSTAWGYNNTANGYNSTVWGTTNTAAHFFSTAWGISNNAAGPISTAWGSTNTSEGIVSTVWGASNTATGNVSTAWGASNTAAGYLSTAWGASNTAGSAYSTVFGAYNIGGDTLIVNAASWLPSDPLLEIGAGSHAHGRANALTLLKNGHLAVGKHSSIDLLRARPETLQIEGALLLGDYTEAEGAVPSPGAIRYNSGNADFEGYQGAENGWASLTSGGAVPQNTVSSLEVPEGGATKLYVDSEGNVLLTEVQGDISMGLFSTAL